MATKEYTVVGPGETEYTVIAPEGATKEQAFEFFKREYKAGRAFPKKKEGLEDYPQLLSEGIAKTVTDPIRLAGRTGFPEQAEATASSIERMARFGGEVDPETRASFGGQVSSGLGQVIGLLAGNIPGALLKGSTKALLKTAAKGIPIAQTTAQGAELQLQDLEATTEDATFEQKLAAGLGGAAIGASELILPSMLRGTIKLPEKLTSSAVRRGIAGFATEYAQEAGAKSASNLLAREVYDPSRELLEGTGEEGAVGGTVGAILSTVLPGRAPRASTEPPLVPPTEVPPEETPITDAERRIEEIRGQIAVLAERMDAVSTKEGKTYFEKQIKSLQKKAGNIPKAMSLREDASKLDAMGDTSGSLELTTQANKLDPPVAQKPLEMEQQPTITMAPEKYYPTREDFVSGEPPKGELKSSLTMVPERDYSARERLGVPKERLIVPVEEAPPVPEEEVEPSRFEFPAEQPVVSPLSEGLAPLKPKKGPIEKEETREAFEKAELEKQRQEDQMFLEQEFPEDSDFGYITKLNRLIGEANLETKEDAYEYFLPEVSLEDGDIVIKDTSEPGGLISLAPEVLIKRGMNLEAITKGDFSLEDASTAEIDTTLKSAIDRAFQQKASKQRGTSKKKWIAEAKGRSGETVAETKAQQEEKMWKEKEISPPPGEIAKFEIDEYEKSQFDESFSLDNPEKVKEGSLATAAKVSYGPESATWVENTIEDLGYKKIAAKIKGKVKGVKVLIADPTDVSKMNERVKTDLKNAKGVTYSPDDGSPSTIIVKTNEGDINTVLHELIHAATSHSVMDPKNITVHDEFEKMRTMVHKALRAHHRSIFSKPQEAMFFEKAIHNVKELIAYSNSSDMFRNFLSKIDSEGNLLSDKGLKKKSMWDKFKELVKRLLGFQDDKSAQDALDRLFDSLLKVSKTTPPPTPITSIEVTADKLISNATINSSITQVREVASDVSKAVRGLKVLYESAADKFDSNPLFRPLGTSIREYRNDWHKYLGQFNEHYLKAIISLNSAKKERKGELRSAFSEYWKLNFIGRTEQANALLESQGADLKKLVDNVKKAFKVASEEAVKAGVMIKDPTTGKEVPFKSLENYFPLVLKYKYTEALNEPDKNPKVIKEITDLLFKYRKIKEPTLAATKSYIENNYVRDIRGSTFSNIERSRTNPFPADMYNFDIEEVGQYRDAWAKRTSQIKHFENEKSLAKETKIIKKGSRAGEEKVTKKYRDLFEKYADIAIKESKDLSKYIDEVQKIIYDNYPSTTLSRTLNSLNTIATGTQLANPVTVTTNLLGGLGLNFSTFPFKANLKALVQLSRNYKEELTESQRLGEVMDDQTGLLQNEDLRGLSRYVSKGTGSLLKYFGYNLSEGVVRTHARLAAKYTLEEALSNINQAPGRSSEFQNMIKREGISLDKLLINDKEETEKYYRRFINLTQGSYFLDQVPVWIDSPLGRFTFKYWKFIQQTHRLAVRQAWEPTKEALKKATTPREHAEAMVPLLRYMIATTATGLLVKEANEALFGMVNDLVSTGALDAMFEDEEAKEEVPLWLAQNFFRAQYASGGLGFLGFGSEMMERFFSDLDKGRVSAETFNLVPAGLGLPIALGDWITRSYYAKETPSPESLEKLVSATLSSWRNTKKLILTHVPEDSDIPLISNAAKLYQAKQLSSFAQGYIKEFVEDTDREFDKAVYQPTERTPLNNKLYKYIVIGDVQSAKALLKEETKGGKWSKQSASTSMRKRHPLNVGINTNKQEREAFLSWFKKRSSQEEYESIVKLVKSYEDAAIKSGVMRPRERTKLLSYE